MMAGWLGNNSGIAWAGGGGRTMTDDYIRKMEVFL